MSFYNYRSQQKDNKARPALKRREEKRDEIWVRSLCKELGIDPKEVMNG